MRTVSWRFTETAAWGWRDLGLCLFLLSQSHVSTARWGLPVLGLCGLIALWRGEFVAEARLSMLEVISVGWLLAMVISSGLGTDVDRSLQLSSALLPALVAYVLGRSGHHAGLSAGLALLIMFSSVQLALAYWASASVVPADWVHAAAVPWLVVPNDWVWVMVALPLIGIDLPSQNASSRGLWMGLVALAIIVAVMLQSRTALLCAVAALLAWSWKRRQFWQLLTGLALVVLTLDALQGFHLLAKFGAALNTRLALWWSAWQIFLESPWTGIGPHNYVQVYQNNLPPADSLLPVDQRLTPWPHNLWLEILAEMGVVGAGFTVGVMIAIVRRWQQLPATISTAVGPALAAFVIAAMLETSMLRIWTWIVLAIILIYLSITKERL